MNENPVLQRFQILLSDVAALFHSAVENEVHGRSWTRAYLDKRLRDDGGASGKFRIELSDGSMHGVQPPYEARPLLHEINDLRDGFPERWYGLLITVFPDKRCEVKFDYDPKCTEDETFWDS